MPRPTPKLEGRVFGELTVIVKDPRVKKGKSKWICECVCENLVSRDGDNLQSKKGVASCGCQGRGHDNHGMCGTKVYNSWCNMRRRCYQKNNKSYKRYGGRGIKVCDRWNLSFTLFYEDMGDPPERGTLGRKNNNGNYNPENCRWESMEQQSSNTCQVRLITYKGVTLSLSKWGVRLGGTTELVAKRLRRGWSEEAAISIPPNQYSNGSKTESIIYEGLTLSRIKWSEKLGGAKDLVASRIRRGWSEIEAVSTPLNVKRRM